MPEQDPITAAAPEVLVQHLLPASGKMGHPSPAFSVTDTLGKTHTLADHAGKTIALSFCLTWCVPCQWEAMDWKRLSESYPTQLFSLIAVYARSNQEVLAAYVDANKLPYPCCPAPDKLLWEYNIFPSGAFPALVVIDTNGLIAAQTTRYHTKNFYQGLIDSLLS